MSLMDLEELEEIKGLLARGRQLGVLTFAEIASDVSELDLDEADVEEDGLARLLLRAGSRSDASSSRGRAPSCRR